MCRRWNDQLIGRRALRADGVGLLRRAGDHRLDRSGEVAEAVVLAAPAQAYGCPDSDEIRMELLSSDSLQCTLVYGPVTQGTDTATVPVAHPLEVLVGERRPPGTTVGLDEGRLDPGEILGPPLVLDDVAPVVDRCTTATTGIPVSGPPGVPGAPGA